MGTAILTPPSNPGLFGQTREAILRLLLEQPERRFYLRQIVRSTRAGSGAVQRELRHLTEAGVLVREQEGRQVYFSANRNAPIFPELQGLLRKTAGTPLDLARALEALVAGGQIEVAFIYGSVASGRETAASGVDLCLVGEASLRDVASALRGAEDLLGREVNPSLYPPEEFRRRLRERSPFLTRIVSGPKHFVAGSQDDLAKLIDGVCDRSEGVEVAVGTMKSRRGHYPE